MCIFFHKKSFLHEIFCLIYKNQEQEYSKFVSIFVSNFSNKKVQATYACFFRMYYVISLLINVNTSAIINSIAKFLLSYCD